MSELERVRLLSCIACGGPVVEDSDKCQLCRAPVLGKEHPYMPLQLAGNEITPLLKWWFILCMLIWIFSGLELSVTTSLLLTAVSIFYLMRVLRVWFSD
jgi:hypothetical protein